MKEREDEEIRQLLFKFGLAIGNNDKDKAQEICDMLYDTNWVWVDEKHLAKYDTLIEKFENKFKH